MAHAIVPAMWQKDTLSSPGYADAFPNSKKVLVESERVRVPMREIALSGGEAPLRVYDTTGAHTDAGGSPSCTARCPG